MAECILFSSVHGTWIMKDHMLNYKTSLKFSIELNYKSITKRHIELPPQIFGNLNTTYHYTSEITGEIRKYFKLNYNEDTTHQNLWDVSRAVLRGKFRALYNLHSFFLI